MTAEELKKIYSNDPKIKYAFAKELLQLSIESPECLYEYFDTWITLLEDENNIIKWTTIDIIGHLSAVDSENRIDNKVMEKLFNILHDNKLITCNHAVYSLGIIAQNKPDYKDKIIRELLSTPDNDFETDDCEAIATGKVLEALEPFIPEIKNNKKVIDFAKAAMTSTRNSTKKKANEFLKLIEQ